MKIILLILLTSIGIACMAQTDEQQKREEGDYNFDSIPDYRIKSDIDTTKWDYYIFNPEINTYNKDTVLSNLDWALFDFEKKQFYGSKTFQISELVTQMDIYVYFNGAPTITEQRICRQKFHNSERSDCDIYKLVDGELVYKETLMGAE